MPCQGTQSKNATTIIGDEAEIFDRLSRPNEELSRIGFRDKLARAVVQFMEDTL